MSPVYSYTLANIAHSASGLSRLFLYLSGYRASTADPLRGAEAVDQQRSWGEVQVVYSVPPTLQVKLNGLVMFSSRIPAQRLNAGVVAASATRNLYLCGCG